MTTPAEPQLRKHLEEHLKELPVLPTVLAQLMTLNPEANDYFDQVLELVEAEPNLSARLLAIANSAASGSRTPITTLRAALTRIGGQGASNIVMALAVTRVFVPRDAWEKSLWRHAVQVAVTTRELAKRIGDPHLAPDEAYTCGLLHDIGRFVMFQEAPDELRRIDEGNWNDPKGLIAMEMSICGLSHAELGALACRHWGIPEDLVEVVRNHHTPVAKDSTGHVARMTALVQIADIAMFPSVMPGTPGMEDAEDEVLQEQILNGLPAFVPLELAELRELLRSASAEAGATADALGI